MLISYNWLKSYVPQIPSVEKVAELITFHLCEIEGVEKLENGDSILDLNILPDRAHDLLSHQGVAREISSLLGIEFQLPVYKIPTKFKKTNLKINIDGSNCNRYMGRIIRDIKVGPSPSWMVQYLENVGQRSINNIVDATNIVMLDCGQPIHAFDLSKLSSEKIVVRNAKEGDTISLVGREKLEAKLKETDMMITDGVKNLAIAGVKGGLDCGVGEDTIDLLIEVASFDAVTVRKTARRLGIQTDASKRYENDLSASLCDFAMEEITSLIFELCAEASFEEVVDVYIKTPEINKVNFDVEYISRILGLKITDTEIEKILKNYNYKFIKNVNSFEVIVPAMRIDIKGAHDMVEEIGRVYGYDKIIPQIPEINTIHKDNETWLKICEVKNKLIKDGYMEVMTSVFTDKGDLEILASASDKNFLRTNIKTGLQKSYELNRLNLPLLNTNEIKIFEIGAVFNKNGEEMHICFADKKEIKEMSLDTFVKEKFSSKVHGYNSLEKFLVLGSTASQGTSEETSRSLTLNSFKMWSMYPFIVRDISVWVPVETGENGVTNKEKLAKIYKESGGEILNGEPILFDEFIKGDKASIGYRLIFQSYERTLTDDEVNGVIIKINAKISELEWEVR